MLIGVTSFFRDPSVWQELKDAVMPALLARSPEERRLRAWVVGCSTGEEAYTLAMIFKEVVAEQGGSESRSLQIFASDLSADAINVARKGLYPQRIAGEMDPVRLGRFFTAQGSGFLINSEIREMVLFAQHDVILDPPFTKLDLLSCRNLMIYFNAELQSRLMPLFSYSLRPGGAMLLGGSETIGKFHSLFTPASPKSRLYWRSENPVNAGSMYFPTSPRRVMTRHPQEFKVSPSTVLPANLQTHAEQALLQEFSPAAVLVNGQGDIVFINGSVGKYLEPASGKANWNIHVMARPTIRTQIAAALRQALQDKGSVEVRGLRLAQSPESAQFDSMPKSAIAAGCVDITGLASELPDRIHRFIDSKNSASSLQEDNGEGSEQAIGSILRLLKARSKHDLSDYKPSTLRRRIQRRLGVHGLTTHEAYEQFARDNAHRVGRFNVETIRCLDDERPRPV